MANILVTVATNVGKYLAGPAIREVQYLLCVNNVINLLENENEALTDERDNLLTRIAQAKERTEVIEKPVEKWLNDVENLLREVEVLVQRTETDSNCFQGWFPTCRRYLLCKEMVLKIEAMKKFKGKSYVIQPFSHRAQLPGIQYHSSEDFIYFESTKVANSQLLEALEDNCISIIGVYGMGGCGKTALVTEVGKKVEELDMFDKVIPITVSRTPNIRGIQGKIADMLNLKLEEESEEGRAQRLWLHLKEKKRILVIVDDLWREFHLMDIGIRLGNVNRHAWKILVVTRNEHVCTLMDCEKKIHLGLLSEEESWTLFRKLARIEEESFEVLDGVPRKICDECKGLPMAIKSMASALKGKQNTEWKSILAKLMDSKTFDEHEGGERDALNCLKLSYDCIENRDAELIFLMCSMFPEDYHISIEDLMRYAIGLGVGRTYLLKSTRSLVQSHINKLLDSCLLMHGCVKMHDMVRDTALWIAERSDSHKILVNIDKPCDDNIRDCYAVSSWWYNENPNFRQWHAPNLKFLLLNINAHRSWNSLDISHLTFEGVKGLKVFSVTIDYYTSKIVPLLLPPSIHLLTNVQTLRLNGFKFGDLSFIASLTRLEVLDLRRCDFNELPIGIGKLKSLKLIDLSECHIFENRYNGAIGNCLQLEELYASPCYPEAYVQEIIVDIITLSKLQRLVLGHPITPEGERIIQLQNYNISKLKTFKKNILQRAEFIGFESLYGGCKNIMPDMVGAVGNMNSLTCLCLESCQEIESVFDTTYDFKEDDLIPKLVELRLYFMDNLTELCRGPPPQGLHFFDKLEILDIRFCWKLHSIFPGECMLRNLKNLNISYCGSGEVLFPISVAQSLQQLEVLKVLGCYDLKHIIAASGREHDGCYTRDETVPDPMNSQFFMPSLRKIDISHCWSLESIFPICYAKGLARLQHIVILNAPELKYVFAECDQEHISSYQNHIILPHLEVLKLSYLHNLTGMYKYDQERWPSQSLKMLSIEDCPKLVISWITNFDVTIAYHEHRLWNENKPSKLQELVLRGLRQLHSISWVTPSEGMIWSFQCLRYLEVKGCDNFKYLFSMEVHRSLPELMSLFIYDCQELEQIVATNEKLTLPTVEVYFPKLKHIEVKKCNKLKSLFPVAMVRMLPQLSTVRISQATQLEELFQHEHGDDSMHKMEIVLPNLTEIILDDLRSYRHICYGCKLNAVKLREQRIYKCPRIGTRSRHFR
ncbi:disease resistance protein [Trifolium repens]|nr:disease resistance protein [Trifolium repens]